MMEGPDSTEDVLHGMKTLVSSMEMSHKGFSQMHTWCSK